MQSKLSLFARWAVSTMVCFCSMPTKLSAQIFQPMRYDENYAYLKDSARTFYHRLKYIPFSANQSVYLSFGGGVRWEFDAFNNEDWGQFGAGKDDFFLQRYDFHADWHLGERVR